MSSAAKFTPGPWEVCEIQPGDKEIGIRGPSVEVDYDDVDHESARADAHLIAAAPDLYAALEETLRQAPCDCEAMATHYSGCFREMARAALAKAGGES